jgi:hypothetical protein
MWEGIQLTLNKGTSVLLYGDSQFRVLLGQVGVKTQKPSTVHEASVQLLIEGDIWLEKPNTKEIQVKNLSGSVQILPLPLSQAQGNSVSEKQTLPPGFENWFAGMNSEGLVQQGTLRPIVAKKFLRQWNSLYRLPKAQAEKAILSYKEIWKEAPTQIAQLYAVSAQRMVASLEAERARQEQNELARRQERKRLLKLYRDRYTFGQIP